MPTLTDAESAGAIREHHVELQDALLERDHTLAQRGLELRVMLADGAGGLGVGERWHRTSPSSDVDT